MTVSIDMRFAANAPNLARYPFAFSGIVWCVVLATAQTALAAESRPVDFSREILPILSGNCFACHGPDANKREADLRLDDERAAKEHAITPGQPGASELVARLLTNDPEQRMPPAETGKSITPEQLALIQRWITEGADWGGHWAFSPPMTPPLPTLPDPAWCQNEIDHFVLHRLIGEGLAPSPPATRAAWLRRVSLDLIGLPPTWDEMEAFTSDASQDAMEKVVDRLLQSPHYGERMAIEWLDVARYADTNGYQNDFNRSMWPWRDWVIRAFNSNLPYDRFLIQQLAGDLLPAPTQDELIATGFNRNHRMVTEGGSIDEEWRVENVVDRVEATSTAFLGLTMGCSRCHDHKYDPITQRDFYQFYAYFNNVDELGVYTETRGNVPPLIPVPTEEEQQKLVEFNQQIEALEQQAKTVALNSIQFFAGMITPADAGSLASQLPQPRWNLLRDRQLVAPHTDPNISPAVDTKANADSGATAKYAGGEPRWVDGIVGPALDFSGTNDSFVDLGERGARERSDSFAWSGWVRAAGPGALLSKMDDPASYRGYDTILLEDLRIKVHLISAWPNDALAVTTKVPVPRDTWFHLAVSYDGSTKAAGIQVWLDGRPLELNHEQDSLTGSLLTNEPLRIGRRSSGLSFTGQLAELQLFDQPLSAAGADRLMRLSLRRHVSGTIDATVQFPPHVSEFMARYHGQDFFQKLQGLRDSKATFERSMQTTMIMKDRAEYRPTYILRRGQYDLPDTTQTLWPAIPQFLGMLPSSAPSNRLGLAQWMVSSDNPLVARVMVNRVWQRMFGRGLVASADNFGVQGDQPSHPELLDWLAVRFVASGWDMKELHKLIALSATYQQSGHISPELLARDPTNVLLARGPRHRLPAELVRDQALAVSGLLTRRLGGPSVKPYQPDGLWDELAGGANGGPYIQETDANMYRRSLYTFRKRTVSHPTLATFDAPSWEICQAKRGQTNTPLQALALLNDTTYVEAARHFALRLSHEAGADPRHQITRGFRLVTSREPTDHELATILASYEKYLEHYRANAEGTRQLLTQGLSQLPPEAQTAELAALSTVASILLNLDEAITK